MIVKQIYSSKVVRIVLLLLQAVNLNFAFAVQSIGQERQQSGGTPDLLRLSVGRLVRVGGQIFSSNWTDQDGGGRPLTKGTGRPLADGAKPLTNTRAFNRISGPDANSCAGC